MKFLMVLILVFVLIAGSIAVLTSCNQAIFDANYTFDYAYIYDTGGNVVKKGNVVKWTDYADGEQLQVWFDDGSVWLTNSTRCDLVHNK